MFNTKCVDFSSESRNVRLGLVLNGFNLYGILSNNHSTWPAILRSEERRVGKECW